MLLNAFLCGISLASGSALAAPSPPQDAPVPVPILLMHRDPESPSGPVSAAFGWDSGNWSGIYADVTLPRVTNTSSADSASIWLQLDGDKCTDAVLRVGVDMTDVGDNKTNYQAWFWDQDGKRPIDATDPGKDNLDADSISFDTGEEIALLLDVNRPNLFNITNYSSNVTWSPSIDTSSYKLCHQAVSFHLGRTTYNDTAMFAANDQGMWFRNVFAVDRASNAHIKLDGKPVDPSVSLSIDLPPAAFLNMTAGIVNAECRSTGSNATEVECRGIDKNATSSSNSP